MASVVSRRSRCVLLCALVITATAAAPHQRPAAAAVARSARSVPVAKIACRDRIRLRNGEYLCKAKIHSVSVSGGKLVLKPAVFAPWQAEIRSTHEYTAADITADEKLPASSPDKFYLEAKETWERQHRCGGIYIGDAWVLTAAHCVTTFEPVDGFLQARRVRLGSYDLSEPGPDFAILTAVVNQGYRTDQTKDDIALLKLVMPAGDHIANLAPARLPTSERGDGPSDGARVYVTGWGATAPTKGGNLLVSVNGAPLRASPVLKIAELKIVSNAQCAKAGDYEGTISDAVICARSDVSGTDACTWDSGGPLVRTSDLMLVGIVSRGDGCGLPGIPGVYTRVSRYLRWIERAKKAPAGRVSFM